MARSGSDRVMEHLLRQRSTSVSRLGIVLEPGDSGSLHMTLNDEVLRKVLKRWPGPGPASPQLLEPLWDSYSGDLASRGLSAAACMYLRDIRPLLNTLHCPLSSVSTHICSRSLVMTPPVSACICSPRQ
jgi:hypothetical protein